MEDRREALIGNDTVKWGKWEVKRGKLNVKWGKLNVKWFRNGTLK